MKGFVNRISLRIKAILRAERLWRFKNISSQDTNVSELARSLTNKPLAVMERV
jgi:hypothetical protein